MKENAAPVSVPAHSPVKYVVKSHEQPAAAAAPPAPASEAQVSTTIVHENKNNQDGDGLQPFLLMLVFVRILLYNNYVYNKFTFLSVCLWF